MRNKILVLNVVTIFLSMTIHLEVAHACQAGIISVTTGKICAPNGADVIANVKVEKHEPSEKRGFWLSLGDAIFGAPSTTTVFFASGGAAIAIAEAEKASRVQQRVLPAALAQTDDVNQFVKKAPVKNLVAPILVQHKGEYIVVGTAIPHESFFVTTLHSLSPFAGKQLFIKSGDNVLTVTAFATPSPGAPVLDYEDNVVVMSTEKSEMNVNPSVGASDPTNEFLRPTTYVSLNFMPGEKMSNVPQMTYGEANYISSEQITLLNLANANSNDQMKLPSAFAFDTKTNKFLGISFCSDRQGKGRGLPLYKVQQSFEKALAAGFSESLSNVQSTYAFAEECQLM